MCMYVFIHVYRAFVTFPGVATKNQTHSLYCTYSYYR
uniref:Uncharacterized protein n=1 Tax=Anopheles dirus TaxID=7168 RepID=A0A182NWZ6_9DIPT